MPCAIGAILQPAFEPAWSRWRCSCQSTIEFHDAHRILRLVHRPPVTCSAYRIVYSRPWACLDDNGQWEMKSSGDSAGGELGNNPMGITSLQDQCKSPPHHHNTGRVWEWDLPFPLSRRGHRSAAQALNWEKLRGYYEWTMERVILR